MNFGFWRICCVLNGCLASVLGLMYGGFMKLKRIRKFRIRAAAAVAGILISAGALAGPVFNGSNQLTGFTGLTVLGSLYNVAFVEGTFSAIFPGGAIFDETTASAAATALYSSFAPQAPGGVSIAPYNILGCGDAQVPTGVVACELMTPDTFPSGAGQIDVISMRHGDQAIGGVVQDGNSAFGFSTSADTTGFIALASAYTWAVWTPARIESVPEPSALLLTLLALGALVAGNRQRRRPR
ncbi:MAG: PEP-CTERM sorting domain-containing protein [Burkholderiaceae bacterium]